MSVSWRRVLAGSELAVEVLLIAGLLAWFAYALVSAVTHP